MFTPARGREAVITGIGVISPLGMDAESTWRRLCEGDGAVDTVTLFEVDAFPTRIGAEVRGWRPEAIPRACARTLNRGAQFIFAAGEQAIRDSGVALATYAPERIAVVIGHSGARLAPADAARLARQDLASTRGLGLLGPLQALRMAYDTVAAALAGHFGARGPCISLSTACASGAQAIGIGARLLREGAADVVLAGGGDAMISPLDLLSFGAVGALSVRNDEPAAASRPFDQDRDGFVLGEGSAMTVIEAAEPARGRGAGYARVSGYGSSLNAYRITDSPPDGSGQRLAMARALADAGLAAERVDYVNAHGTSTSDGDVSEARAIKGVFGAAAGAVPVSSTKGATGHLISGAGSIEACFCCLAIRDGLVPPTLNLQRPDRDCDLQHVRETERRDIQVALTNSFGFGGTNASLVLTACC
jgi:3-oxoacyl-[acyl-carrier-protein] synthase II